MGRSGLRAMILSFVVFSFLLAVPGWAAEHFVPTDPGCDTVQHCIDQSANGDVVTVLPGTYPENIDFLGKAITVRSRDGAETTILEGDTVNSVVRFASGEGRDSVLEGFTVRHGGGTLNNLIFDGRVGGGIYVLEASPTIASCVVAENAVAEHTWKWGGGIGSVSGSPFIADCQIVDNLLSDFGEGASGGGVFCGGGACEIARCTISRNLLVSLGEVVVVGGGILAVQDDVIIDACVVSRNELVAEESGYVHGGGIASVGGATIRNTVVAENAVVSGGLSKGGGILLASDYEAATLEHCTVVGNTLMRAGANPWGGWGGGLATTGGTVGAVNSIFWGNSTNSPLPPVGNQLYVEYAHLNVQYSDVSGGLRMVYLGESGFVGWGEGNIDADPFLRADSHLGPFSPCIDQGTDAGVAEDIDGEPRPQGAGFDMGADEAPPAEPWAAAPAAQAAVAGVDAAPGSAAFNYLLLVCVPMAAAVAWTRRRRGR